MDFVMDLVFKSLDLKKEWYLASTTLQIIIDRLQTN